MPFSIRRYYLAAKLIFAALSLALPASAQNVAAGGNPGVRIKQLRQEMVVDAQGRRTTTTRTQFDIATPLAATQMAQIPVHFDGTMEDAEVLEAYTLKSDGRKLPVDPSNILTQNAPQPNALVPLYLDGQQKLIIFPNVQAGDSLIYTTKLVDKQVVLPGQFTLSHYFTRTVPVEDTTYSVTVPKAMHVRVSSSEMSREAASGGDTITYRWGFSNPTGQKSATALVNDPDTGPHFLLSSFKDYDELGHAYAGLILAKIGVTSEIQKRADLITVGIADRKQQAQAIYSWMTQNIRYVGIELGNGAIVPHDVDWTLTNAFGDCKDQAVLFVSLLKAKGIAADPVLINSGNRYRLSGIPTTSEFNHVIVWLPEWGLYADTTARNIPFQMLPLSDYGKPAIHLVQTGKTQETTPVVPERLLTSSYKVRAVMNNEGEFDVETSSTATRPWASNIERVALAIQAAGPVATANALLKARGFPNATGTINFVPGPAADLTLNGKFHTALPPGGNLMTLAMGMQVLPRAGDGPLGPLNDSSLVDAGEIPCYSAQQWEDISFEFPNDAQRVDLAPDVNIKTDYVIYESRWAVSGNRAALHQEFIGRISVPTCSGPVRHEIAQALAKIRSGYLRPVPARGRESSVTKGQ